MKNNTISGSTEKCLRHFFEQFGRSELLIEFVQITSDTEKRWRKERVMPQGETLLRLRHFLEAAGYEVEELKNVPDSLRVVGQCIAFKLVTLQSVVKEIGLSQTQDFFAYFRGDWGVAESRIPALKIIGQRHISELLGKLHDFDRKFSEKAGNHSSAGPENDEKIIAEFRTACTEVRRLGKLLTNGPLERRIKMRRLMGEGTEPELHLSWEALHHLLNENPTTKGKL